MSSSAFVTKGGRKEGRKKEREEEEGIFSTHRGCIAARVAISRDPRNEITGRVSEFMAQAPDS